MGMPGGKLLEFICESIKQRALGLGSGVSAVHQHRMTWLVLKVLNLNTGMHLVE